MADSLPTRRKKVRLLTRRDVYKESRLTKTHLEELTRKNLIRSLVDGPNPLYSFEQLEAVIAALTDQAIALTDLESLRHRMRELRWIQTLSDEELKLFYRMNHSRPVEEDDEEEAA
jgi:hypothetical protein